MLESTNLEVVILSLILLTSWFTMTGVSKTFFILRKAEMAANQRTFQADIENLKMQIEQISEYLSEIAFNTDEEAKARYRKEWKTFPDGSPIPESSGD